MGTRTSGGGRRVASARTAGQWDIGDIKNLPEYTDRQSLLHDVGMWLDGKTGTVDGMRGRFQYTTYRPRGSTRTTQTLVHQPNAAARETQAYREQRQQLGDDFVTDLTNSDDLMNIARSMKYRYGSGERRDRRDGVVRS